MKPISGGVNVTRRITDRFLFISSVFYFRLPQQEWRDRLEKVKIAGYNTVDVYIPWNFHEPSEGLLQFSGDADVDAFLTLCEEMGLFVIARPGPYICSEWDGGGIPAWVYRDARLAVRQYDATWLHWTEHWYEQIVPVLLPHLSSRGGCVLAVQVENELDFFPCENPRAYMDALFWMMRRLGVDVPITACIGQGDLDGATGRSEHLLPMFNFYPQHPADPALATAYNPILRDLEAQDIAPLTMETNRDTLTLSRLVASGVQGIAPYLMVSGIHRGPWQAINNWRAKPSYLATDYDFGGMVTADGRLRATFYENRLLTQLVYSAHDTFLYGRAEGADRLSEDGRVYRQTIQRDREKISFYFNLQDSLHTISGQQLGTVSCSLTIAPMSYGVMTENYSVHVGNRTSAVELVFSTNAAIVQNTAADGATMLVLAATPGDSVLCGSELSQPLQRILNATGEALDKSAWSDSESGDFVLVCREGIEFFQCEWETGLRLLVVVLPEGIASHTYVSPWGCVSTSALVRQIAYDAAERTLWIRADVTSDRIEATWYGMDGSVQELSLTPGLSADGTQPTHWTEEAAMTDSTLSLPGLTWLSSAMVLPKTEPLADIVYYHPLPMDHLGVYQGQVVYEATLTGAVQGIYVEGAADLVWVYVDGRCEGVFAGDGRAFECMFSKVYEGNHVLHIWVESWGHSNFHDDSCQSLVLGSMKGILGPVHAIRGKLAGEEVDSASGNISVSPPKDGEPCVKAPIHGWNTARVREEVWQGRCVQESSVQWPLPVKTGERYLVTGRLSIHQRAVLSSIHLRVAGENARMDVWLDHHLAGRLWFGPQLSPHLVGGRTDALWLENSLLEERQAVTLRLFIQATADGYIERPEIFREGTEAIRRNHWMRASLC